VTAAHTGKLTELVKHQVDYGSRRCEFGCQTGDLGAHRRGRPIYANKQFQAPPNAFKVRIAVCDVSTRRLGSISIPLTQVPGENRNGTIGTDQSISGRNRFATA